MDSNELVKAVQEGKFSPEKVEALNNTIRLGMASSLVKSVNILSETEDKFTELSTRLAEFINSKVSAQLDTDSITLEEAFNALEKVNKLQVMSAETKRKIFNGKEMFGMSVVSQQEKALLEMLKQVDTPAKRSRLEKFLTVLTEDEYSEVPKEGEDKKTSTEEEFDE